MDWVDLVKTLGVSVVALFALAWAVWRVAQWVGTNVILPLVKRLLAFIDKLEASLEQQNTGMANVAQELKTIVAEVKGLTSAITEVRNLVVKTDSVQIMPSGGKPP